MNNKFLNFIIGFSLIGITLIFISDYFNQSKTSRPQMVFEPTIAAASPTPSIKPDPLVSCQNDFFNFQKGTIWRYRLAWGEKKKTYFFSNKIVESSTNEAQIETKFDNDQSSKITKLICRQSGIFGFPYPFFPPKENNKIKINGDIFFLPAEAIFQAESKWTSFLKVDPDIPFVDNVTIEIENKINESGEKIIFGKKRSTASVEAYLKKIKLPIDILKTQKEPIFKFQLIQNIGIERLELQLNKPDGGVLKSEITLISFTPVTTSSSQ